MVKKTTKGFGELTELVKDFAKEVGKQTKEGTEDAIESITGLKSSDKSKKEGQREVEELRESDHKYKGPKIVEERQALARLQAEERRTVQQKDEEHHGKIINLEEERRLRQVEKGKMRPVKIPSGTKRASILPLREKASTEEYIPQSVERIKRKAA